QNGGILLREQLSKRQGYREDVKVFTAKELEKATNNYHESKILRQGGQRTMYKRILVDNRIVANKKSIIGDPSQVPLLVYEYITNGTLFHHLHHDDVALDLPWKTCLRITIETAEALSYLHSTTSIPIIHWDIKLANILLDNNYNAKVFYFGASRLIPSDKARINTILQGTFGYLDPKYMLTSFLTEKILPMYFVSLMKEDNFHDILDPRVLTDENVDQLKKVAVLARRCVRTKGDVTPETQPRRYG
ncbi:hypothetical protein Gogos_011548, partial [Gossypium gossypioides]|nr:hypothetical protein [Gossypium gossypioides]